MNLRSLASLAVLVVACGDGSGTPDGGPGSDAATTDVDIDATSIDAGDAGADVATDGGKTNGLDPSGKTIPDTSYAIPQGAIFVSPSGNDTQPGTEAAPVATLAKAIALVPANGTIVARGGTYRDGSSASVTKTFTLQAYPHEQPWFDGTDVVTTWTASNGQWYVDWDTSSFCAGQYYSLAYGAQTQTGPCAFLDEYGDPKNPAAADPQLVFIDGVYVHEVTTLGAATGANFFYDQNAKRLYLGTDPSGHTVELAKRPMAIAIQGGAGGNVVRGIGFRKYATNEYNANVTHAAIFAGAPTCRFENDVFTANAGAGLSIGNPSGAVVVTTVFAFNGANGLDANGHQHSTQAADGLDVEDNVFNGNNAELFGTGCGYSCSAAGSKMAHMDGFTLKNNVFENAAGTGKGFWCDLACSKGVMVGNVFANNGDTGLMYEVSDTGIIASNVVYGNGAYGLKIGSANTKVYNNTIANNQTGALIYDDDRSFGVNGITDVGPDTANVEFVNNIVFADTAVVSAWRTNATSPNTGPNTFYKALDYNDYYRPNDAPSKLYDWRDGTTTSYASCSALNTAKQWEAHCLDVTTGPDTFFVNAAAGDFRLATGSPASQTGTALPSDVAAALGVPASPIDRGAIHWAGNP